MNVRSFSLLALAAILSLIVGDYSGICPPSPPILGGVGWFPPRVGGLGGQGWGAQTQPSMQRGISYATWWPGNYSHPDADLSLANLASTGANWIGLIVTGYQDTITSTTIITTSATPTDADLIHVVTEAHGRGLKVMLKPHVDLLHDDDHVAGARLARNSRAKRSGRPGLPLIKASSNTTRTWLKPMVWINSAQAPS